MKIAATSAAFDREIAAGELTQLEWLDACAHDLRVDGVVCEIRHFPRTDREYLAQVKKTAADVGLTVAAVAVDDVFSGDGETALGIARAIGAPLVLTATPHASDDPASWNRLALAASRATSVAKGENVTLAVAGRVGRVCSDLGDVRRLAKEADSAWFRYAPDLAALASDPKRESTLEKAVLLRAPLGDIGPLVDAAGTFVGFLVPEPTTAAERTQIERLHERAWRTLAEFALRTPSVL
ncbi:MAG: hypothetical protein NVSMB64_19010 [Candidatus Velthaea sp.]